MKKELRIKIGNIHCANCVKAIETYFNNQEGIKATVILGENETIFVFDDEIWNKNKIENELKKMGYKPLKNKDRSLLNLIILIVLTLPFLFSMIMMMNGIHLPHSFKYFEFALSTVVLLFGGIPFYLSAIRDIKNKVLGMDVLVSIAISTSYIYSTILLFLNSDQMLFFETTAMLITIVRIGKYLEGVAKKDSSSTLRSLLEYKEVTAKVQVNDKIITKELDELIIGDIIIISTGEKVPIDGEIIKGSCEVDESMISGESQPIYKTIGETLLQGTIIVSGNISLQVSLLNQDTYLSRIIRKSEDIISQKPHIQKIADKVASIFVPTIIAIGVIIFIVTYIIYHDLSLSLSRLVSVLVISCPCSLGLATPLSILVSSSRALKKGVIYNNSDIFQKSYSIDAICFDKTNTITTGKMKVLSMKYDDSHAIDVLYTMENYSNHPIAKAVVEECKRMNAKILNLEVQEIVGKGLQSNDYYLSKENETLLLKENDKIILEAQIQDEIKIEAKEVITSLTNMGIDCFMITGDNKHVADKVAKKIKLETNNLFSEVQPFDKLSIVESLKSKYNNVAFVGDGINDTLALNAANISIAMGSGSDIAINSSDIVLTNNKLSNILFGINLSRKTYYNIIENFVWAFIYNVVAIPMAILGVVSPMLSGIFMGVSSISVVLNSLRLKRAKIKE